MSLFMSVLSLVFQQSVEQKINYLLSKFKLDNNCSLPHNFYQLIFDNDERSIQLFRQLTKRVKQIKSASGLIKIFTIILKTLRFNQYNEDMLDILQEIEIPQIDEITNLQGNWIKEITISLKSYLKRLPSCRDILMRINCTKNTMNKVNCYHMVSDLYRLLNVANLLFPGLTIGINIVGRYYKDKLHYFTYFFNAINEEIMQGYGYICSIFLLVKNKYKEINEESLQYLIDSLSIIELYCDKTEELFLNKYFKSKGLSKKISIKQE